MLTTCIIPYITACGTHAARPPFPCAPTYSGPSLDTSHLSVKVITVYEVMVATVGPARLSSSRKGDLAGWICVGTGSPGMGRC